MLKLDTKESLGEVDCYCWVGAQLNHGGKCGQLQFQGKSVAGGDVGPMKTVYLQGAEFEAFTKSVGEFVYGALKVSGKIE